MRADEYIVEKLLRTERELREVKEELEITNIANKSMQERCKELKQDYEQLQKQTEKYCRLLDELKQYFVKQHTIGNVGIIKVIFDNEAIARRTVAYDDEPIYNILLELLGPLTEEETE